MSRQKRLIWIMHCIVLVTLYETTILNVVRAYERRSFNKVLYERFSYMYAWRQKAIVVIRVN